MPSDPSAPAPFPAAASALSRAVTEALPATSCAVLAALDHRWQVVGTAGPADPVAHWHHRLRRSVPAPGRPTGDATHLIVPLDGLERRVLVAVAADPARPFADGALRIVLALAEDARSALRLGLDRQRTSRTARRLELQRCDRAALGGTLEQALARDLEALWPAAQVALHDRDALAGTAPHVRRLVREATDLRRPAQRPAGDRLVLPTGFTHEVALPVGARTAAVLAVPADGEPLDQESVAVALAAARQVVLLQRQGHLTEAIRLLQHEDPESGCRLGTSLHPRIAACLHDPAGGGLALLLLQVGGVDPTTAHPVAAAVAHAVLVAARGAGADVFRLRPLRFAVVAPTGSARDAGLLAQKLRLAVRTAVTPACAATVGIALAPLHGRRPEEVVDAAEDALAVADAGGDGQALARARGRRHGRPAGIWQRLDALRTLARVADRAANRGLAHADGVAERAGEMAGALQLRREERLAIQLAGELHELGRLALADGPAGVTTAVLGARLIRHAGLPEVANVVAALDERFDGGGPHGLAADAVPLGSRIVAVADAYETALHGLDAGESGPVVAAGVLRDGAGTRFDPALVRLALTLALPPAVRPAAATALRP